MTMDDLAPQMPAEEPITSDENTALVPDNGETIESTPVNDSQESVEDTVDGVDPNGRAADRIKALNRKYREEELKRTALEAELNTLKETQKSSGGTTLQDLSIDELESVLDDEQYSEHHGKVRRILNRKYAEDVVNQKMETQQEQAEDQRRRAIGYQLAEVVGGKDVVTNESHPLNISASQKYDILSQNVGDLSGNPLASALAIALARIDDLQSKVATPQSNPSVDRRARIEASTRAAAAPIGGLKETLAQYKDTGLSTSRQGRRDGSLREVLKKTAIIQSFKES